MHAYQRNNKSKGQKNLRCFPSCCVGFGHQEGFCGQSVTITLTMPKTHPASNRLRDLVGIAEFAVEGSPARRANELVSLGNPQKNIRRVLDGQGEYLEGCRIPWRESERLQHAERGEDRVEFEFNKHLKGWHYGFLGSKKTREFYHVFRAYVVQRDSDNPKLYRVLACVTSPPWQMYCRRRKHTTHMIHQRIENPIEFAKTPSSDRCAVATSKQLKVKRKSVDEVEAELATEAEQIAEDGHKKRRHSFACDEQIHIPKDRTDDAWLEPPAKISLTAIQSSRTASTCHLLVQLLGKMQLPNPFSEVKQEASINLKRSARDRDVVDLGYELLLALQQFSSPPAPKFWNVNRDNVTPNMKLRTRKCLAAYLLRSDEFRYQFLEVFATYQMKDEIITHKLCELIDRYLPAFTQALLSATSCDPLPECPSTAKYDDVSPPRTPKGQKDELRSSHKHLWFSPAHSLKSINTESLFSPSISVYGEEDARFLGEVLGSGMLSPVGKDKENLFQSVNQKAEVDACKGIQLQFDGGLEKSSVSEDFSRGDWVDGYNDRSAVAIANNDTKPGRPIGAAKVESNALPGGSATVGAAVEPLAWKSMYDYRSCVPTTQ